MMRNKKLTGKQKLERQKEIIVESLKLPKDSMLGASIVTVARGIRMSLWKITREFWNIRRKQSFCKERPARLALSESG